MINADAILINLFVETQQLKLFGDEFFNCGYDMSHYNGKFSDIQLKEIYVSLYVMLRFCNGYGESVSLFRNHISRSMDDIRGFMVARKMQVPILSY